MILLSSYLFADFEGNGGLYGYFNNNKSIGFDMQLGYIGNQELKGSLLVDMGLGYVSPTEDGEFYFDGIAEYYYKIIGIGIGLGYHGTFDNVGNTYYRLYIPLLFDYIKLSLIYEKLINSQSRIGICFSLRGDLFIIFANEFPDMAKSMGRIRQGGAGR
jgi:hypothetical protein